MTLMSTQSESIPAARCNYDPHIFTSYNGSLTRLNIHKYSWLYSEWTAIDVYISLGGFLC